MFRDFENGVVNFRVDFESFNGRFDSGFEGFQNERMSRFDAVRFPIIGQRRNNLVPSRVSAHLFCDIPRLIVKVVRGFNAAVGNGFYNCSGLATMSWPLLSNMVRVRRTKVPSSSPFQKIGKRTTTASHPTS